MATAIGVVAAFSGSVSSVARAVEHTAAAEVHQVQVRSSADGTRQRAWFFVPNQARCYKVNEPPVPLVVALHSWKADYAHSTWRKYRGECSRFGFVMIHPNFRGPNTQPEACGSDLAVQDVLDAVAFAKDNARVDPRRIYLVGAFGGGHLALLAAARAPQLWAGVSVWGAPTDLAAWYREVENTDPLYADQLHRICGGPPGSPATDPEYRKRSPLFHLAAAKGLRIDLNAGINDGHEDGPTRVSHTLRAFNALAQVNDLSDRALPDETITQFVKTRQTPQTLPDTWEPDICRETKILFRRAAGPVRLTLFQGTEELRDIDYYAAVRWLSQQPARDLAADAPSLPTAIPASEPASEQASAPSGSPEPPAEEFED